jgi:hypothetical protein
LSNRGVTPCAGDSCPGWTRLDNNARTARVVLWNALPSAVTAAPVFAQNPETFRLEDQSLCRLEPFLAGIARFGGWLPPEWLWYAAERRTCAMCCGIFAGHDLGFIRHYAESAIEVIRHPANRAVWPTLGVRDNILVEQYFLAACLASHGQDASSPHRGLPVPVVARGVRSSLGNESRLHPSDRRREEQPSHCGPLEARVQSDYPDFYERCIIHLDG